jgi:hypothetical protein
MAALGHRHLLFGPLAFDDFDQIFIGQHLGKLQHGQRHRFHVAGQTGGDVVGNGGVFLELAGQRLAHAHLGVLGHQPEDILRQLALGLAQPLVLPGDLVGDLGTDIGRRIGQQPGDVFLS